MRIAIVAHAFPPYVGGLSYVVENLSVNLARRGFEVEVVTLDIDGNLPKHEEYGGVIVRRFRGYAPDGCYYAPSLECVRYLKNIEADVVHVHNVGSLLTFSALHVIKKRGSKPRIVVTPHHHESGSKWHTKLGWKIYKPLIGRALRRADIVHTVSSYEASLVKKDFGLESIVIPNGVSEDVFNYSWNPPKDRVVITYAGRVERYKRVDLVIEVAHTLSETIGERVLVRVIGRGPDLPRIIKLAKQRNVEVEALGFLPRDRYLGALASSTVFMNLSDYEAFSIVTAEALAIGVPAIIAKPWGRTFEGIRGAYVVDKHNIREVVGTVVKVYRGVDDPNYGSKLDEQGEILPWHQVVEQIVRKLYL